MNNRLLIAITAAVLCTVLLAGCGASANTQEEEMQVHRFSDEEIPGINRILSSVAEQGTASLCFGEMSREQCIDFVHTYVMLHTPDIMESRQLRNGAFYDTISLNDLNSRLFDIFGKTYSEDEVSDYMISKYDGDVISSVFHDGYFFFMPSAAGNITRVAITGREYSATGNAEFTIYDVSECKTDLDILYGMDNDHISQIDGIIAVKTGKAVVVMGAQGKYVLYSYEENA